MLMIGLCQRNETNSITISRYLDGFSMVKLIKKVHKQILSSQIFKNRLLDKNYLFPFEKQGTLYGVLKAVSEQILDTIDKIVITKINTES